MTLKINFEEIKNAIENSSLTKHYFIDKINHKIILFNEEKNNIHESNNNNFIEIPTRTKEENKRIMELFIYTINNFDLAEKFYETLDKMKSSEDFNDFNSLLDIHPELKNKWIKHKDHEMKNETMNFICENNLEFEDKNFIPKIEIKEINLEELKLPKEFEGFSPQACLKCENEELIKARYFKINVSNENMLIDKEINKIMIDKYNINNFGYICSGKENSKNILNSAECSKCKSSDIFWDF